MTEQYKLKDYTVAGTIDELNNKLNRFFPKKQSLKPSKSDCYF